MTWSPFSRFHWQPLTVPQNGGKLQPPNRMMAKPSRHAPAPGKAPTSKRRRQWR